MGRQSKILSITFLDHCFYALLKLARLIRAFKTITSNTVLKRKKKKRKVDSHSVQVKWTISHMLDLGN